MKNIIFICADIGDFYLVKDNLEDMGCDVSKLKFQAKEFINPDYDLSFYCIRCNTKKPPCVEPLSVEDLFFYTAMGYELCSLQYGVYKNSMNLRDFLGMIY